MVRSSGIHTLSKRKTKSKESTDVLPGWSVMTMVATAVSPPCSPDLARLLLNSDVRISGWPWCTKWCMDWWQYPQLILPQQIPAPEPTTVISFGLSILILRLISIPSFREPFLLGTSYLQKPAKLHPSMHSSIVFRSSAFHLHRHDIPSRSLPITFQIQIQSTSRTSLLAKTFDLKFAVYNCYKCD